MTHECTQPPPARLCKGKNAALGNIWSNPENPPWYTMVYWISRAYAIECIQNLKRPLKEFDQLPVTYRTSEMITRSPKALASWPILAIDEMMMDYGGSDLRNKHPTKTQVFLPLGK
jgi:hypothetical protein